jgi:thioredoxin reductase (NADPH)
MKTLEKIDCEFLHEDFSFVYDLVVIGGGISGISAALEASDRNLRVLLIEECQLLSIMDSVPEFKDVGIFANSDLFQKIRLESILNLKDIHYRQTRVANIMDLSEKVKRILVYDGTIFAKSIIFATGIKFTESRVYENFQPIIDPIMDVVYYIDKTIAFIGENVYSFRIVEYLSKLVKEIHFIIGNTPIKVSPSLMDRVSLISNVKIYNNNCNIITPLDSYKKIILDNDDVLEIETIVDCLKPIANIPALSQKIQMDNGFLCVDKNMQLNVPGFFAVGSCRKDFDCSICSSINDARLAVNSVENFLLTYL